MSALALPLPLAAQLLHVCHDVTGQDLNPSRDFGRFMRQFCLMTCQKQEAYSTSGEAAGSSELGHPRYQFQRAAYAPILKQLQTCL